MKRKHGSHFITWLGGEVLGGHRYRMAFEEQHIGNPWLRSLHGGVVGSFIEFAGEEEVRATLDNCNVISILTSSVDYMRITLDQDLNAMASLVRQSGRIAIVDVVCWQDNLKKPVARGSVTLRIDRKGSNP